MVHPSDSDPHTQFGHLVAAASYKMWKSSRISKCTLYSSSIIKHCVHRDLQWCTLFTHTHHRWKIFLLGCLRSHCPSS